MSPYSVPDTFLSFTFSFKAQTLLGRTSFIDEDMEEEGWSYNQNSVHSSNAPCTFHEHPLFQALRQHKWMKQRKSFRNGTFSQIVNDLWGCGGYRDSEAWRLGPCSTLLLHFLKKCRKETVADISFWKAHLLTPGYSFIPPLICLFVSFCSLLKEKWNTKLI